MTVTIEDIEALRRVLAELPRHQPKEVSKQEAIAMLSTELGGARRRGYNPDELARIMSERGVAINAATLRGYLRRNRKSRSGHDSKSSIDREGGAAPAGPSPTIGPAGRPTPTSAGSVPLKERETASPIPKAPAPVGGQVGEAQGAKPSGGSAGATNAQSMRK